MQVQARVLGAILHWENTPKEESDDAPSHGGPAVGGPDHCEVPLQARSETTWAMTYSRSARGLPELNWPAHQDETTA